MSRNYANYSLKSMHVIVTEKLYQGNVVNTSYFSYLKLLLSMHMLVPVVETFETLASYML